MRISAKLRALTLGVLLTASAFTQTAGKIEINIPFEKFVLPNGLTLIVHEDRKAPIVAVNVWYHVGSKNEKPGKTGFAHLFEHLMFNGSKNFNDDYFQALDRLGATDLNGTTNNDRTNYFQNVPTSGLDQVLFLESDRMGHLLPAIDQKKLDEQRGVVQNEKRQMENAPYGLAYELATKATYPAGHPYSWTVIGSMEDLNAASLKDVQDWFKTYYGASNAVVVIAGDIDAKTAKEKVEKYFGWIPPGPPPVRYKSWIAKRTGMQRQVAQDQVPQARIYKIWNVPPGNTRDAEMLDLSAAILGGGRTSRLYKRLVLQDQLASSVQAQNESNEIAGQFNIEATARPGVPLAKLEAALDEEVARFLHTGPTEQELKLAKTQALAGFLRGIERIGGFGGKSDVLATCEVYTGDPGCYKKSIDIFEKATWPEVKTVANQWLRDGVYILEVHPKSKFKEFAPDSDRSKLPAGGAPSTLRIPTFHRTTLSNGLKIVLAERHETPTLNMSLQFDAGYAADLSAVPGTASMTNKMFTEGTAKRNGPQISERSAELGAQVSAAASLDTSAINLSALKMNLDDSLELYADIVRNPAFPAAEFDRVKKLQHAQIQREKSEPNALAQRLLPGLIYGKGHAYGNPMSGSGTDASLESITRDSVANFYNTWYKPNNATLHIVGDTTIDEIKPKLEKLFGDWKTGEIPKKNVAQVQNREKLAVYIVDRPGAIQSVIMAGQVGPPRANPDEPAIDVFNSLLGGSFVSRLNMNLREDKHWSYGAFTTFVGARGQRPFLAIAPVQSDKTKESLEEMVKEFRGVVSSKPVTDEEVAKMKESLTRSMVGERETKNGVLADMLAITRYGLPEDYFTAYAQKVNNLKKSDVQTVAERILRPDRMIYVVVGDRAQIEKGIRELNLGDVQLLDADGNPAK
ncbi:MAG TPA: pitrilysin family protein [Bryobacteraceae bacterium]|nr:pitrilysin family protein [Bryobacteraceae bacterium]